MKKLKPVTLINHPQTPALAAVVEATTASKDQLMARSYQQLVTSQGVAPERARQLLGLPEK